VKQPKYAQLEERLIDFAAEVCRVAEDLPGTRTGNHVAGQMIRCGTSPAPNYGEAQGAESRRDFIHKLRVCLKELRETSVWIRFLSRARLCSAEAMAGSLDECNQLISIFVSSIRTATDQRSN
jgi:four helix bundle protein